MLTPTAAEIAATSLTLADTAAASTAVIAPHRGAIVTSFSVNSCELLYLDPATFDDPTKNVRGGIPVLFPCPGKLEQDTWRTHDRTGSMKQHGFARTLPWTVTGTPTATRATLALQSSETTLSQYPWRFQAELEFALNGPVLRIATRVQNDDDTPMPFALGFHPYFQVHDKARTRIETNATRAYNNVSKQSLPFAGFDLKSAEVDLHLLNHTRPSIPLHLADDSTIELRASPEFSVWVLWTLGGKEFVCLEPWTAPGNALNTGERLMTLAPGKIWQGWFEIEFVKRTTA